MNAQEALDKVIDLISLINGYDNQGDLRPKIVDYHEQWPELYDGYNMAVRDYMDIKVHSERSYFPERLFVCKSPNINDEEFTYLKANYKNTTMPVFMDFVNSIGRSFSKGNWDLSFKDEAFGAYIEEEKEYKDWFKNVLPTLKLKDANGVISAYPRFKMVEGEAGAMVIDDTQMLDVDIKYYSTPDVWHKESKAFICLEKERVELEYGNTTRKIGRQFTAYTPTTITRIVQVGKYTEQKFVIQWTFEHGLKYTPAWQLGGVPMVIDNSFIYQSPFLFAVDNLDLALINENNLQTSLQLTMYPYRVMVGDECDFEQDGNTCFKGQIQDVEGKLHQCPSCHGSGMKNRPSRMGTMLVNTQPLQGDGIKPSESMVFVQPGTDGLKFVKEVIHENERKARQILHLYDTNDQPTGKADTATGSKIDQESQYAFIQSVSDGMFAVMYNVLWAIGEMRYGADFDGFNLVAPVNFDFRTREDYARAIVEAQKMGVPVLVEQAIYEAIQHYFHANDIQDAAFELLKLVDGIFVYSPDQVTAALRDGTVSKLDAVIHFRYLTLIENLLIENPNFFEQPLQAQIEAVKAAAKVVVDSIKDVNNAGREDLISQLTNAATI